MNKARAWINKKIASGVSREYLLHTVGSFSNKKKSVVMKQKGLTSKQYDERYAFLAKVYYILSGG